MKVEKLDHFHIYVKDLEKAKEIYGRVLGTHWSPTLFEKDSGVKSVLSPLGIELIEPASPDSPVAKTLERRGEGLAGITFKVADIEQAIAELESQGMKCVGKIQLGSVKEAQFHPAKFCGVMLELTEYQEQHAAAVQAQVKPHKGT